MAATLVCSQVSAALAVRGGQKTTEDQKFLRVQQSPWCTKREGEALLAPTTLGLLLTPRFTTRFERFPQESGVRLCGLVAVMILLLRLGLCFGFRCHMCSEHSKSVTER